MIPKSKFFNTLIALFVFNTIAFSQIADKSTYLNSVKYELQKTWPNNKTMNLVFHGHSVPSGYFATPNVNTLEAYPYTSLVNLKGMYPYAVLNTITTSIGGEQAEKGQLRFASEVLCMRPDVLFIDYAINDRGIGLERARAAWVKMIEAAIAYGCKVMLLTPTPISSESLTDSQNPLALHAQQIRDLAAEYHVGLVDSYLAFQELNAAGVNLSTYYAQSNHVNGKGHKVVADKIKEWFTISQTTSVDVHFDFENNNDIETTDKLSSVKGTFSGTSVVVDSERGKVLSLPTAQSYMKINTNPLNNSEFSISFWIKIPEEVSWKNIFYFTEASGKHLIGMTKEDWFPLKQFCFYNKSIAGIAGTGSKLDINTWQHIVLTSSSGISNIYLNGVKKTTQNILALNGLTFTDFYIGTPDNTSAISFVDDVIIKKVKLSDSEVLDLYNNQKNTVSALNKAMKSNVKVYPNPVKKNEKFNIELPNSMLNTDVNYSIYNSDGKLILQNKINTLNSYIFSHKFKNTGIYFVNFSNKTFTDTLKISVI